ncbi:uncharacterized protein LOC142505939 [Primulina tabacum]|uniref:uncharacterized protein LOC142505939 n=1 Tax=Primulina tabacum TaxID=48773 RepID=UPI003F5A636E
MFPEANVIHQSIIQSDHAPLLIKLFDKKQLGCKGGFRFQAAWLTHEDFPNVIREEWDTNEPLEDNVVKTANVLPIWNRTTFGDIYRNKRRLIARIEGIQKILNIRPNRGLIKLEKRLRDDLDTVLQQEELLWCQKSREEWIILGDRNTKFYHASTLARRSRIRIGSLQDVTGQLIVEEEETKKLAQNYFTSLFQATDSGNPPPLQRGLFPKVEDLKLEKIHAPFSANEIKQALFDLSCNARGFDYCN